MAVLFKQKCMRCKKNYVTVSRNQRFVTCYECQKNDIDKEVKDPEMKKMFDIPEEFYKENAFLRDIKSNYIRWGKLTERQIEAFKKTVDKLKGKDMKEEKTDEV